MNQSTNYNFNLPEGTDLVNLLTQLIPNWSNLDTILKGVENQAFTNCTEVTSLGVHAISRTNAEGKILKWIATANFTAGETFTVDGNVVAATTPAGATLATGAYVTGSVVIAALNSDESAMTIFVSGTNVATDSERLGGELPSYYATATDMGTAQNAISDLDNLMGTTSISAIGDGTATGAISAINGDLTANGNNFIFAYDSTSQSYGYKAGGADTFHPFSSKKQIAYIKGNDVTHGQVILNHDTDVIYFCSSYAYNPYVMTLNVNNVQQTNKTVIVESNVSPNYGLYVYAFTGNYKAGDVIDINTTQTANTMATIIVA